MSAVWNTIIINSIVYVLFPILLFYRAKINKNNLNTDILSRDDSAALRGMAAVFIMFSHYLTYVDQELSASLGPAKILEWFGGLGVCLFFFLSGYGLWFSISKGEVNGQFLWKRFQGVVPTFLVLRLIFGLALGEYKAGIGSFVLYLLGFRTPLWFVSEIILIYLLLFVAARISKKKVIGLTAVFLTIMSVVFLILGFEARWYNANMVFVLGMLIAKNRESFVAFFEKKYWLKVILAGGLFVVFSGAFVVLKAYTASAVLKLIAGGLFSILFVVMLMKIRIQSPPMIYLGKKSLQCYIIHITLWLVYDYYIPAGGVMLQLIVCLGASILMTVIYSTLEDAVRNRKRIS